MSRLRPSIVRAIFRFRLVALQETSKGCYREMRNSRLDREHWMPHETSPVSYLSRMSPCTVYGEHSIPGSLYGSTSAVAALSLPKTRGENIPPISSFVLDTTRRPRGAMHLSASSALYKRSEIETGPVLLHIAPIHNTTRDTVKPRSRLFSTYS